MNEPRRPIFWFLWPRPDPSAPVDDAFVQERPLRITPRGPIRIALLVLGTVTLVTTTGSALLAALSAPLTVAAFLGAAISATGLVLILRGWVVGTSVSDRGIIIDTTFRRRAVTWAQVDSGPCEDTRAPLLGLPLRVPGRRIILRLTDGRRIPTHIYSTSPDLFLRREAFDAACDRWENWRDGR